MHMTANGSSQPLPGGVLGFLNYARYTVQSCARLLLGVRNIFESVLSDEKSQRRCVGPTRQ